MESFEKKDLLKIENLLVEFKNGENILRAVDKVNLNIKEGEFTIILGASGSGKTTLLNAIAGMRKPTSGIITFKNKKLLDLSKKSLTEYRKDCIGFIFQQYNLIDSLTVKENIQVVTAITNNKIDIMEILRKVGLEDKVNAYPRQLSGGQQQRVCIARALVKESALILCDEPTGALDTENSKQIIKLLLNLSRNEGRNVLIATHNKDFIPLADRCITMENGSIVNETINEFPQDVEDIL